MGRDRQSSVPIVRTSAVRLAIDTSGPVMSVALGESPDVIACEISEAGGKVCEELNSLISSTLRKFGKTENDISEIAIATGPGSFTGVRTGIAIAQGLSIGLNLPLYGVGVLQAVALSSDCAGTSVVYRKANPIENFFGAYKNGTELLAATTLPIDGFESAVIDKVGEVGSFYELTPDLLVAKLICALPTKVLTSNLIPIYVKSANARTLAERGLV